MQVLLPLAVAGVEKLFSERKTQMNRKINVELTSEKEGRALAE